MFISSLVIGILAITISSDIIINEASQTIVAMAKDAAKLQSSRIDARIEILETMAVLDDIEKMVWSRQKSVIDKISMESLVFDEIGVIDLNGTVTYANGNTYMIEANSPLMDVFKDKEKVIHFSSSKETNELALFLTIPIKQNGKVVGGLLGRSNGTALSELAADTGYGVAKFKL